MKAIALIAAFLFFSPENQNDLARQKLKGKVRSVTNCQCPVKKGGVVDSNGCTIYVFKFGETGNQVEDNDYYGGSLYRGLGKLNHKRIYKYDGEGRQSGVDEYNPDGTLNQKVVYKYDDAGNRTVRENYTADGQLWFRSVFAFDEKGNKTECTKYNPDSVLLEHYTYSYDEHGNMVMEQHVTMRSKNSEVSKEDKKKERTDLFSGMKMIDYIKTYVYDDSGLLTSQMDNISKFSFPFETDFTYENFDAAGNWLKQVSTEYGKPVSITERIIEYYK